MKKICIFTNSMFKIGGEQRIVSILSNGLIKKGYEVTIIIKNKEETNLNLYNLSNKIKLIKLNYTYDFRLNNKKIYEYLRILNRKTGIFKNNIKLIKEFFASKELRNDLINIFKNNTYDTIIGIAGDRSFILSDIKEYLKEAKLILWNHQNIDVHFIDKYSRYYNEQKYIKPLIKRFDNIICLTKYDKDTLSNNYNVKVDVIPNCKSFITKEKSKLNYNRFIACGRLEKQKNFLELINIMKEYNKYNNKVILDIYGEGSQKNKLLKYIKKNKLKNVFIHNNTPNIKEELLKSDLFLITSIYEGFGLITLEALECGLPVIGFDIEANKEIIKNNINGYLTNNFNSKEFVNKMIYLSNYKNRLNIQKNISKTINKYNEETFINNWIKKM